MGIVFPAGLCQILDVCWNIQGNGWTFSVLDQRENVRSIVDVGKGNLMCKYLVQDHPIGEHIAALVDPMLLVVEFWCHPTAGACESCHGNSALKNPSLPEIAQLENISPFKEQHIWRFQIKVGQALLMEMIHSHCYLLSPFCAAL